MSGVPLEPTPPEARELLRRELDGVEYLDSRSLLERLGDWIDGFSLPGLPGAGGGPVSAIAAVLVVAAIVAAVVALVLRLRRDPRTVAASALLEGERIDADELRARAERQLAEGDAGAALLDAFRALAVRQIELGAIDDLPGATAGEVAAALGAAMPSRAADVRVAAGWFDDVLYGDRAASAEQARAVLDLDRALEAVA